MTTLNMALDKITAQQGKHKQGSAPWCVGEQLKDILHAQPEIAKLVVHDLDQTGMSLADCEKKIVDFAKDHRQGSVGSCGPADADRIIRTFYGLPAAPVAPCLTSPADSSAAPKRKTIRLADFL